MCGIPQNYQNICCYGSIESKKKIGDAKAHLKRKEDPIRHERKLLMDRNRNRSKRVCLSSETSTTIGLKIVPDLSIQRKQTEERSKSLNLNLI